MSFDYVDGPSLAADPREQRLISFLARIRVVFADLRVLEARRALAGLAVVQMFPIGLIIGAFITSLTDGVSLRTIVPSGIAAVWTVVVLARVMVLARRRRRAEPVRVQAQAFLDDPTSGLTLVQRARLSDPKELPGAGPIMATLFVFTQLVCVGLVVFASVPLTDRLGLFKILTYALGAVCSYISWLHFNRLLDFEHLNLSTRATQIKIERNLYLRITTPGYEDAEDVE